MSPRPDSHGGESKLERPFLFNLRSSDPFILFTVCLALFTDSFIYGIIVPVIPHSLKSRSGIADDQVQFWTSMLLTSFGAAQFICSPIVGYFADQSSSRRTPLLIGLLASGGTTALLYLARDVWLLTLSRFLQGVSAAIVYTVGVTLVEDVVGQEHIGQWMGIVLAVVNIGMMISPALGGVLYAKFGYESLFIVIFVLIGIDILLRLAMIEKDAATAILARDTNQYGTFQPTVERAIARQRSLPKLSKRLANARGDRQDDAGAPLLIDRRDSVASYASTVHPPALITLLKSPQILTDLYGTWIMVTVLIAFDAALPIFVEKQFGWGSIGGGLIFLSLTIPAIIVAPIAGGIADRFPSRFLISFWWVLTAVFVTNLLWVVRVPPIAQKPVLCVLLALTTIVNNLGQAPLAANLSKAVADIQDDNPGIFGNSGASAQVYSLFIGSSAGGTLTGPLLTSFTNGGKHWTTFVAVLGGLCLTVAVSILFCYNRDNRKAPLTTEPFGQGEEV
ncbi:major facilitator superfamily domain-containing protein [Amylocarpus encephaloides]|uniref:Major facilitator superfamily domain-containing protein n=1 Tax=Amylocarpus encephaloides TaxID=45428 RepID=A0A9P8C1D7_9HELO|nr:major facilitator superfamily domain-containing protein [Amylocarpus encephaloides]